MLQIDIQTNGFELTPAIEEAVEKAAHKISQVDGRVATIIVFLDIQKRKDDNGCKVTFKVEKPGKDTVVSEEAHDLYECINIATKSTVREVRKEKEKELGR